MTSTAIRSVLLSLAVFSTVVAGGALAEPSPVRIVPERILPVPSTVSVALQKLLAQPLNSSLLGPQPTTKEEWAVKQRLGEDAAAVEQRAKFREMMGVSLKRDVIGGVPCFILTPKDIPSRNRHRLLVHFHGGGYTIGDGEKGTYEGVLMAAFAHMKVISVDYRLAPAHPYPAAVDDAIAVWRKVTKQMPPRNIGVAGSSAGGGLTLLLVQRAIRERLPVPGALAVGTPAADLSKTGDTYFTNAGVDNTLIFEGFSEVSRKAFANGLDLRDPNISPVYGEFRGFPPTILISGTRDLLLSNTVRVHRRLRDSGVRADLVGHFQFLVDPDAPETKIAHEEFARFLDENLGR